jgi:hypothetical protein
MAASGHLECRGTGGLFLENNFFGYGTACKKTVIVSVGEEETLKKQLHLSEQYGQLTC